MFNMSQVDIQRMQCMEVWGGNQPADSGVSMLGLDAWVYSHPYGDASGGGDVHYVSSCATGRVTRVLVADVSGHGEIVSNIALALRRLMRRHVNFIDQTRFVREMNREFGTLSTEGRFATAVVGTYFAPRNQLSICNAGHPAPFLFSAKSGRWSMLRSGDGGVAVEVESTDADSSSTGPSNLPLGIIDQTGYEQVGVRMNLGDMALLYSDSLIESRNAAGAMLGEEGLLDVVRSIKVNEPVEFIPTLLENIRSLHEGNLSDDDVTVLLVRTNGVSPRVPFLKRAFAPIRVLIEAVRSLRRGVGPAPWPEFSLANLGGAMWHRLNRAERPPRESSPPPT